MSPESALDSSWCINTPGLSPLVGAYSEVCSAWVLTVSPGELSSNCAVIAGLITCHSWLTSPFLSHFPTPSFVFPRFLHLSNKLLATAFLSQGLLLEKSKLRQDQKGFLPLLVLVDLFTWELFRPHVETLGCWEDLARIINSYFVFIIIIFWLPSIYCDNDFPFTFVI